MSCQSVLKYRIGTLDPRFGITREEFQRFIDEAGGVWASNQISLKYDRKAKLRINLVYDTRQEVTQRVITIRAGISARMREADLIESKLPPLKRNFHALEGAYSDQSASYKQAQDSYNQEVKKWNIRGGAPEAEFSALSSERQSLRKQHELLETERQDLARSTDEFNELVKKHDALLTDANAEASALNSGAAGIQFEEGGYVRAGSEEWIDIFQFEGKGNLPVILAHELGHALGMKHNANPSSIMSPLIHTDHLALTAEDQDGVKDICALQ